MMVSDTEAIYVDCGNVIRSNLRIFVNSVKILTVVKCISIHYTHFHNNLKET